MHPLLLSVPDPARSGPITHVVSRARIMREVFGYDFDGGSNVADVYVSYLRRKLNGPGETSFIKTVRGAGYRFKSS